MAKRHPTSINIDASLWKEAKIEAIKRNLTITELLEYALIRELGHSMDSGNQKNKTPRQERKITSSNQFKSSSSNSPSNINSSEFKITPPDIKTFAADFKPIFTPEFKITPPDIKTFAADFKPVMITNPTESLKSLSNQMASTISGTAMPFTASNYSITKSRPKEHKST